MGKLVDRINELARKNKTIGLTAEEQQERETLRQQYLAQFRANFRDQLNHIHFEEDQQNKGTIH